MGLLLTDIIPFQPTGPTPLIPSSKDVQVKVFQIARTDTVSSLKAALPADASITDVSFLRNGVSNAGTSASVTINVANTTGTISTGAVNLVTNGDTSGPVQMNNLPNIQPIPLLGDLQITAVYAESGTASSSGGPWKVIVTYVR